MRIGVDFGVDNPPPLVPRYLRKGVIEKINSTGRGAGRILKNGHHCK